MRKKAKFLTTAEFADAVGVHPKTVRRWDENGFLKPNHRTPSGIRQYTDEQVDAYFRGDYCKNIDN